MNNSRIRRGNNVKYIYEILREDILTLRLPPGQVMDEQGLAERFSVSRSPVREVLIKLVADGLICALPNKSAIVSPLNLENFPSYIDALDLIQRVVTKLAAELRTEDDLVEIEKAQGEFKKAIKNRNIIGMIENNKNFHLSIASAAKNRYFYLTYEKLLDEGRRIQRLYYLSLNDTLPKEQQNEHEQMIRAIRSQDINLAEKIANQHAVGLHRQFILFLKSRKTKDFSVSLVNYEQKNTASI